MSNELTILCVDDERIVLSSLKEQLRRRLPDEVVIETADTGADGLDVFDELREGGARCAWSSRTN